MAADCYWDSFLSNFYRCCSRGRPFHYFFLIKLIETSKYGAQSQKYSETAGFANNNWELSATCDKVRKGAEKIKSSGKRKIAKFNRKKS